MGVLATGQEVQEPKVADIPGDLQKPRRDGLRGVTSRVVSHARAALCTLTKTCLPFPPVRQRVELRDPLFFSFPQFIPFLPGNKNAAKATGTGHHKRPTRLVALCV